MKQTFVYKEAEIVYKYIYFFLLFDWFIKTLCNFVNIYGSRLLFIRKQTIVYKEVYFVYQYICLLFFLSNLLIRTLHCVYFVYSKEDRKFASFTNCRLLLTF